MSKHYGAGSDRRAVVREFSWTVPAGLCVGLLGPNGAGKTTCLKMALGHVRADSGRIELLGEPIPKRARQARRRVGVVPQFDNLDPDFTVEENLIVYARYFGLSDRAARARVPELLDFAGLSGRARARIAELSGGMRRRLTIARALVHDPELIILDEPTTGLDPQARHLIWERLKALRASGRTLIVTTHFMDEAERLCDQLCVIDGGGLIAEGSPRALIERLIEPVVVEVFGEALEQAQALARRHATRVERAGETLFCYTEDAASLMAALSASAAQHRWRILERPANLEDVFIKLTGRELRE
ncbi:MAG: ATP-binding cassette domain-containing protein [Casimicrobiaceae bacterium]|nr:ATP-binding cassette domain-containing protein [Casimicrobiaceae bacterium]MCX8097587.1 ATP-binding cassette domain-containing protein [Casimicrobiaceae bacterium]MDW8312091.1 ATP-binding cassette domain-containing protein [Burkholderiales bacterium]